MEWYNILITILGTFGGGAGLITLYQARSNKNTIDINNFHLIIEEEREERRILRQEYEDYKESVNAKVAEVKKEVEETRQEKYDMMSAILQGYGCRLPAKPDDCPVIRRFRECQNCNLNNDDNS